MDFVEQADIEVHVINQHNMERRTLFYWSRMYLLSLPAGKLYQNLKPAITINLLSYCVFPQDEPHLMSDGHTDLVIKVISDEKIRNEYYAKCGI